VLLFLARQLWFCLFGCLNVDEFEEFQVIWLFDQGVLPYRDFFHTHLPVYDLLLYPLYALLGPRMELPGLVRILFFPVVIVIVLLIGWLAKRVTGNSLAGWLAVALFLSSARIGRKLAEMRPDSIGLVLVFLALLLWFFSSRKDSERPGLFYLCGLVLGVSLLFSQKTFLLIIVMLFFLERAEGHVIQRSFGVRLRRMGVFILLLLAPFGSVILLLWGFGLMDPANLQLFATSGLHHQITEPLIRHKQGILISFFSANVVVIGTAFVGAFLLFFTKRGRSGRQRPGLFFLGVYAVCGTLQLILQPIIFNHLLLLPFIALSILSSWALMKLPPGRMLCLLVPAILLSNALDPHHYLSRDRQMETARFVRENVDLEMPILDSLSGYGTFRPIIGKFIYYRPGTYDEAYYARQSNVVQHALKEQRYGAVIDSPLLDYAPEEIRRLIQDNYQSAPSVPDVLLLKKDKESGKTKP